MFWLIQVLLIFSVPALLGAGLIYLGFRRARKETSPTQKPNEVGLHQPSSRVLDRWRTSHLLFDLSALLSTVRLNQSTFNRARRPPSRAVVFRALTQNYERRRRWLQS